DTAGALAQKHDVPSLLVEIGAHAKALLGGKETGVMLYDAARKDLVAVTTTNRIKTPLGSRIAIGEGVTGGAAQRRQPVMVNAYEGSEFEAERFRDLGIQAALAAPMLSGGELVGVLTTVALTSAARAYDEDEVRVLSLFATQAASAIRTAQLLEETRQR